MESQRIDERMLTRERDGGNFLVVIYEGGNHANLHTSWSVDSYLLTQADLPSVFHWLREKLPQDCCWSLGVVEEPHRPTPVTEVNISWVVGSDVLNRDPERLSANERRLAEEMLTRRHHVAFD